MRAARRQTARWPAAQPRSATPGRGLTSGCRAGRFGAHPASRRAVRGLESIPRTCICQHSCSSPFLRSATRPARPALPTRAWPPGSTAQWAVLGSAGGAACGSQLGPQSIRATLPEIGTSCFPWYHFKIFAYSMLGKNKIIYVHKIFFFNFFNLKIKITGLSIRCLSGPLPFQKCPKYEFVLWDHGSEFTPPRREARHRLGGSSHPVRNRKREEIKGGR